MTGGMVGSNDNEKRERISEVRALYKQSDVLYSGVVLVDNQLQLSGNGQSIMNDIEYFLRHPKYRVQIENALFEQLRVFAETILQEE